MCTPSTSAAEAYAAAAAAAFHPSPDVQKELLSAPDAVRKLKAASELLHLQDGRRMLSSEDLELLSMLLLNCSASSVGDSHLQQQQVPAAPLKVYGNVSRWSSKRFWCQHERAKSMVPFALDKFNKIKVPKYKLHVICGVNEKVFGPEFSLDDREIVGCNSWSTSYRYKYHHSHINFLATRQERANAPATLFFAECSNHGTGTKCWCVPVSLPHPDAEQVRACSVYLSLAYLDLFPLTQHYSSCQPNTILPASRTTFVASAVSVKGIRIVHPDDRNFHGRDEFEKLFYGSDHGKSCGNNDDVIIKNGIHVDWVHDVGDDAIYRNYDCADEDEYMELHIS